MEWYSFANVLADGSTDDVAILVIRVNFAQAEEHIYRSVFDANNPGDTQAARRSFVAALSSYKFGAMALFNAELVFGELIGNVVQHSLGDGNVEIAIDASGDEIVFQ